MIPLNDHELQEAIKTIYKANSWFAEIGETNVVYVAGPMTGIEDFNRRAFWIMEHCLKLRRCRVLSPAHYNDLNLPYEWYIRRGLQMTLDANTLVMLNGWSNSKGANIEHRMATACGNKIYYKDGEKALLKG